MRPGREEHPPARTRTEEQVDAITRLGSMSARSAAAFALTEKNVIRFLRAFPTGKKRGS